MQAEQTRKMEEFRTHVTENMAKQFADIQEESQQQIAGLKQVIEEKAKEGVLLLEQQHSESREARCSVLEAEIQSAESTCKAAQEEAADLRVRLAAAQQK
ncbi:Ces1c, partial [Symbiodinium pilosum]